MYERNDPPLQCNAMQWYHCNSMQCNGIIAVLLPINSAMIESLNGNKSFKNIYKDEKELRNSVYVVFYVHKYAPAMCNSPLYLSCHQDIPKLDIF